MKNFLCGHIARCFADHCESIVPSFTHDGALEYRSQPDELLWSSTAGMLARIHKVGQDFTEGGCELPKVFQEWNSRSGDFTTKEVEVREFQLFAVFQRVWFTCSYLKGKNSR